MGMPFDRKPGLRHAAVSLFDDELCCASGVPVGHYEMGISYSGRGGDTRQRPFLLFLLQMGVEIVDFNHVSLP